MAGVGFYAYLSPIFLWCDLAFWEDLSYGDTLIWQEIGLEGSVAIYQGITKLIDLILPPVCYSCHKRIINQTDCLCIECSQKLKRNHEALQINRKVGENYLDKIVAIFYYEAVIRNMIHHFKYHEIYIIGRFLSNIAAEILKTEYPELLDIDGVIAVPMHRTRQRERVYNQAHYLAKYIAKRCNLKDYSASVIKTLNMQKQSYLPFEQRIKNPKNSFKIKKKADFKGLNVLIIDDVFTTGATANELAKILKMSGAKRVFMMAMASGNSARKMTRKLFFSTTE